MKISLLLLASLFVFSPNRAEADAPRGSFVWYGPNVGPYANEANREALPEFDKNTEDGVAETHRSNTIFMNGCFGGGCSMRGGYPDDARIDKSSIIRGGSATISEFSFGQGTWDAVVTCVRDIYEPFNIEIVSERPTDGEYFMAIVAGTPQEAGMSNGVGGVSPFNCGIINNAVTYSFANIYGGSVQQICEVVAQETAHAFGLEHEFHCPDPMTYLNGCGPKRFRDIDAECGEFEARACDCGGSSQNSVSAMMSHFGPSQPTPPTVTITEPKAGESVQPNFIIRVDAVDNVKVEKVELYINGALKTSLQTKPWVFNAPEDVGQGNVNIEVRAYDNRNEPGSGIIDVVLGSPCTKNSECEGSDVCLEGRCVDGPDANGGLGQTCENGDECSSGICANDGTDKFCVETCTSSCPSGFDCLAAGDSSVCWPGNGGDGGGGGCSTTGASGRGTATSFFLLLMFGMLAFRRRRS